MRAGLLIHHVSQSIQVSHAIAEVGKELDKAIDRLFLEEIGQVAPSAEPSPLGYDIPAQFGSQAYPVTAEHEGYVQVVDDDQLLRIASEQDVLLRIEQRPGDFVVQGTTLVHVWPGDRASFELAQQLTDTFALGSQRTETQDIEFPVNQLVEIAVHALSPAVNDPFTAMTCIDRLGAGVCHLADRERPSACRYDDHGALRVIAQPVTFTELTDAAFNQIRQYGRSSAAVTIRLLGTIAVVAARVYNEDERDALRRQAMMIERGSRQGLPEEQDQHEVREQYQVVIKALEPA